MKLYIHSIDDFTNCETCGGSSSSLFLVSEQPIDSTNHLHSDDNACHQIGSYASCYGGESDKSLDDVIRFINEKYSLNIDLSKMPIPDDSEDDDDRTFDEYLDEYHHSVEKYVLETYGVELVITHEEAEYYSVEYDRYDDDYDYDDCDDDVDDEE